VVRFELLGVWTLFINKVYGTKVNKISWREDQIPFLGKKAGQNHFGGHLMSYEQLLCQ
jgi:hypothetical protein